MGFLSLSGLSDPHPITQTSQFTGRERTHPIPKHIKAAIFMTDLRPRSSFYSWRLSLGLLCYMCFAVRVFNKLWLSAETLLFQLLSSKESIPATLDIIPTACIICILERLKKWALFHSLLPLIAMTAYLMKETWVSFASLFEGSQQESHSSRGMGQLVTLYLLPGSKENPGT